MKPISQILEEFQIPSIKTYYLEGPIDVFKPLSLSLELDLPGLYFVFIRKDNVLSNKPIYVGKSDKLCNRIGPNHDRYNDFINSLGTDEELEWYVVKLPEDIPDKELSDLEAATIYDLKPKFNDQDVNNFHGGKKSVSFIFPRTLRVVDFKK